MVRFWVRAFCRVSLSKYQSVYLRGGMADDSTKILVKVINLAS